MKSRLIITIAIIFTFNYANGQFKILSDGSSTALGSFWTGGIRMSPLPFTTTGLTIPCIYPATPFYLTLGTQSNHIAGAFIWHNFSSIYDTWPSDGRLKNNIQKIDSAIQKVKMLNPVKYDINSNLYDSVPAAMRKIILQDTKNRLGFVAQEFQAVFPQSVHKEPVSGYYGICTMDLIPVLVQAIKEQQAMIEDLQKKVNGNSKLKSSNVNDSIPVIVASSMSDKVDTTILPIPHVTSGESVINIKETGISSTGAKLQQNVPNPFNSVTRINYYLPDVTKSAFIYIYDLQGTQKKSLKLNGTGEGNVTINGNELSAGMYYYTLVVDGKEIDTKKLILTD